MVYKFLVKRPHACHLQHRIISVSKQGLVCFSKDLRKILDGFWGVQVMLDEEKMLIGFKPSNDKSTAYALHKSKDGKRVKGIFLGSIFKGEKYTLFPTRYNQGIISFSFKEYKLEVDDTRLVDSFN